MDWQPIETAPKGATVIVWTPSHGSFEASKERLGWYTPLGVHVPRPTHWMPLPEPPK